MLKKRTNNKNRPKRSGKLLSSFVGNAHKLDGKIAPMSQIDLDRAFGQSKILFSKHHADPITIMQTVTTPNAGAIPFQLSDIADYANYTAVFDEYQIWCLKVRFMAKQNAIPGFTASYLPGDLVTAWDYDDTATVSYPAILNYNSAIEVPSHESITRISRPKISVATFGSGVLTNYTQITPDKKIGWCDNADPNIVHNGMKWAITAGTATQSQLSVWVVHVTYYCKWRNNI